MKESEKPDTSRGRFLKYGSLIVLIVVIGIIGNELMFSACAQDPCTAASPCLINGVTYTTGSRCGIGEGTGCGYISTCETIVDTATNKPHCDCVLF